MTEIQIIAIIATLMCSAFFSGMEIAFISADRLRIELDKKNNYLAGRIYAPFIERPSRFIGAMLVGNNIALVIYGIVMSAALEPWIMRFITGDFWVLLVQITLSTLIILIIAEFIPKVIFRTNANRMLNIFSIPVIIIYWLLYIPSMVTVGLAGLLLRVAGINLKLTRPSFGRTDLTHYIESHDLEDKTTKEVDNELEILKNALSFGDLKARECMVPRNEITGISVDDTIEHLKENFIETGFSKIMVFRDNIDNIIGYVHNHRLFEQPDSIANLLLPVMVIPESMPARDILTDFIEQQRGVAVVLDEFGGTAGMICIEDVIEEIFGEIEDEHDKDDLREEQGADGSYLFSARHEVDYINTEYGLSLPENDEYETLGGLILHVLEHIPKKGETIELDGWVVTVMSVANNRIGELLFNPIDKV